MSEGEWVVWSYEREQLLRDLAEQHRPVKKPNPMTYPPGKHFLMQCRACDASTWTSWMEGDPEYCCASWLCALALEVVE